MCLANSRTEGETAVTGTVTQDMDGRRKGSEGQLGAVFCGGLRAILRVLDLLSLN